MINFALCIVDDLIHRKKISVVSMIQILFVSIESAQSAANGENLLDSVATLLKLILE